MIEDAVMTRSFDEDKVVLEEVADERGPEANNDVLLEHLASEEGKMLAVTSS